MKKHRVVKFNRIGHVTLWEWIAKETAKGNFVTTIDWPGWKENGGKYCAIEHCFACAYANQFRKKHHFMCENCPLKYGCYPISEELSLARMDRKRCMAAKLALKIAHLKIKDNVICK